MIGLTGYGAYIPRLRLQRKAVAEANAWMNPALMGLAKGERSMCNWDEDSLTMAVEASRDCLTGVERDQVGHVVFASTTMPFEDRQNSGVLSIALNLDRGISSMDVTSSQRAGTTALLSALDHTSSRANGKVGKHALCAVADSRKALAASPQELTFGCAGAAVTVGDENVIAEYKGSYTVTDDFVDHYRGEGKSVDYNWEERWIKEEGYNKIIPAALTGLFEATGVSAADVDHLVVPLVARKVPETIAKIAGVSPESVRDPLSSNVGDTGVAHPLLMLVAALEDAKPGDKIVVCGFGQGCDVLLFEATDALSNLSPRDGATGNINRRKEETNYMRYLTFNGLLDVEKGIRAEKDRRTPLSSLYRNRDMILGMVGGKCRKCGTAQFPKSNICVNPNCHEVDSQDDLPFADRPCKIVSWASDSLAYSIDPPAYYGMVQFESGGRINTDFTDCIGENVEVGQSIKMMFRVRDVDEERGFKKYFWKAAPVTRA
jgi:3-hydroxy-3-methylglutaryl CoA synthase